MPSKTNRRKRTQGMKTLQTLVDLYFARGFGAVRAELVHQFGGGAIDRFYWLSEEGKFAYRTDVGKSSHLEFKNFSPPPLWQAPYAVSLARFQKPERGAFSHFIYHGTEELLLPIEGSIQYSFFHSRGGEPANLKSLPKPITSKTIVRINPQIPHSTAALSESATAWMIFRDATNASARLVRTGAPSVSNKEPLPDESGQDQHAEGQRLVSRSDLNSSGGYRYALIAWNIAELVHNARLRSALSLEQLGKLVGMDRTSLSRLERGDLNIRLDRLFAICNELDLDIAASIRASEWCCDSDDLPRPSNGSKMQPLLRKQRLGHILRTFILDLKKGHKSHIEVLRRANYSSWIALHGRLIIDIPSPEKANRKSLIVNERAVLHFRSLTHGDQASDRLPETFVDMHAVEDSRVLVVTCDDTPEGVER